MDKSYLEDSYTSGMSMAEIASHAKVSLHKVSYWMLKYKIPSRSRSDAGYIKKNPDGDPFKITIINTKKKADLMALGIALFIGEGTKKTQYGVRLANSDPKVIRLFLNFLQVICGVNPKRIKAWINIFDDSAYNESLNFWHIQTGLPKNNFFAPVIRKRKEGTYKNKSRYGTITVIFDNSRLLNQIKKWCDNYLEKYADIAQW